MPIEKSIERIITNKCWIILKINWYPIIFKTDIQNFAVANYSKELYKIKLR